MSSRIRTASVAPLLPYSDKELPPSGFMSVYSRRRPISSLRPPRHAPCILLLVASIVSFGLFASRVVSSVLSESTVNYEDLIADYEDVIIDSSELVSTNDTIAIPEEEPTVQYSPWVVGPPTQSFRDNLRNDTKYMSSWYSSGWNNDVMTMMNLIYLAKITERVPIIPTFTPSFHIGQDAPGIDFGEIFDVPRFIQEVGVPILEWHEVKDRHSDVIDELGCWGVWQSVQYYDPQPRDSDVPRWLKLDISYTQTPDWIKMIPNFEHDKGASFWALARFAYPEDRNQNLHRNQVASPLHNAMVDPDEQLLCYDYLYYVGAHQMLEWDFQYGPAWHDVGRYLRWTPEIETIGKHYVSRVFGLPVNEPVPPYISIHVRHGDFGQQGCWAVETIEDCYAPLSAIARRVQEVHDEILERHGVDIPVGRVIVTSDETSDAWWQGVEEYGWIRMDHDKHRTTERYGRWHPLIIDSVIQSRSLGFVGTDQSTFSMLSRRRVLEWNDGVVRMVRWGRPGADDH